MKFFLKKFSLIFLLLSDVISFYLALILAIVIRKGFVSIPEIKLHLIIFSVFLPLYLLILKFLDLYKIYNLKKDLNLFLATLNSILYYLLFSILIFYLFPYFIIAPKTLLLIQSIIISILVYANRTALINLLRKFKILDTLLIIGKDGLWNDILKTTKRFYPNIKFITCEKLGLKKIEETIEKSGIKLMVYPLPLNKNSLEVIARLTYKYQISALSTFDFYEKFFGKIDINFSPSYIIIKDLIQEKPMYEFVKRFLDIILGFIGFLIFLIILPLIFILIKLDDGDGVIFSQKRVGLKGKPFRIYKFRTMISNAQQYGPLTTTENDKRITRVGKFLRKIHIDEIPQFINLLKNEISLIGPRPEQPSIVRKYTEKIPFYNLRHMVKPGILGWAQVINYQYARDLSETIEKTKYDLYYIKNRNLILDLEILLKTFLTIVRS